MQTVGPRPGRETLSIEGQQREPGKGENPCATRTCTISPRRQVPLILTTDQRVKRDLKDRLGPVVQIRFGCVSERHRRLSSCAQQGSVPRPVGLGVGSRDHNAST